MKPCDKLSYDKDLTKLEEHHFFLALSLEWEKVHDSFEAPEFFCSYRVTYF